MANDTRRPDRSLYRDQLDRGFYRLLFSEPLESEFRHVAMKAGIGQLRVVLTLGLLFGLVFPAWDYFLAGPGFSHYTIPLRAAVTLPVILAMIVATFFISGRRFLTPLGVTLGLVLGLGSVFFSSMATEHGIASTSTALVMQAFYVYLFLGLRFWPALLTALAACCSFLVAGIVQNASEVSLIYGGLFLSFANVIGAVGLYNLEYSRRQSFLEGRELEYVGSRDALTGLANRRAFDEQQRRVWDHCRRERIPLAIALLDVDHFKAYNDTYGHRAGDRCLIRIAEVLDEQRRRPLDMVARYGGEEFVVLLPGCSARDARALVEELRVKVEEMQLTHEASPTSPVVTISAGVSVARPNDTYRSAMSLLQSADTALYAAKSGGRNRVVVAGALDLDTVESGIFRNADVLRRAAGS